MSVEILISAVDQEDVRKLIDGMKIEAKCILIHQCDRNAYEEFYSNGYKVRCFHFAERGIGLSRNNALMRAEADLILFSDDDVVFDRRAIENLEQMFEEYPKADMLLFNVRVCEERRTYWNESVRRVRWYNCGRYPTYSFALRTKKVREKNLSFSLLFGGGARFSNGEDSLFIRDCLRAGLRVYTMPICIGREVPRPSTWFFGLNRKFFYDRGVLYHFLYGRLARPLALRFFLKQRRALWEAKMSEREALQCLMEGVRDARKGKAI